MEITHVIRAEEWISSTPKHVCLYQAFGWEQPEWIHMPLLRNADKSKISKRKNPAARLTWFQEEGYLPEALVNYLALIGWSPGNDEEILPLDEMARRFSLADVGLSAGVFDEEKLAWVNRHYLKAADPAGQCQIDLAAKRVSIETALPADRVAKVIRDAGYSPVAA